MNLSTDKLSWRVSRWHSWHCLLLLQKKTRTISPQDPFFHTIWQIVESLRRAQPDEKSSAFLKAFCVTRRPDGNFSHQTLRRNSQSQWADRGGHQQNIVYRHQTLRPQNPLCKEDHDTVTKMYPGKRKPVLLSTHQVIRSSSFKTRPFPLLPSHGAR